MGAGDADHGRIYRWEASVLRADATASFKPELLAWIAFPGSAQPPAGRLGRYPAHLPTLQDST